MQRSSWIERARLAGKAFRGICRGRERPGDLRFATGRRLSSERSYQVEDVCGLEGEEDGVDEEEAKNGGDDSSAGD